MKIMQIKIRCETSKDVQFYVNISSCCIDSVVVLIFNFSNINSLIGLQSSWIKK